MKKNLHNIKFATIGWFLPTHLLPTHKKPANCANFFSLWFMPCGSKKDYAKLIHQ